MIFFSLISIRKMYENGQCRRKQLTRLWWPKTATDRWQITKFLNINIRNLNLVPFSTKKKIFKYSNIQKYKFIRSQLFLEKMIYNYYLHIYKLTQMNICKYKYLCCVCIHILIMINKISVNFGIYIFYWYTNWAAICETNW